MDYRGRWRQVLHHIQSGFFLKVRTFCLGPFVFLILPFHYSGTQCNCQSQQQLLAPTGSTALGVTYNISHPQNNSASAWANHMMTTGSNMVTPYWALLRRLCKERHLKKNTTLRLCTFADLPNSILMFCFYQRTSNANAIPLLHLRR